MPGAVSEEVLKMQVSPLLARRQSEFAVGALREFTSDVEANH